MNKNQPLFIAHRGESYDAPENTLAAINLAWEKDADAVEVDVHLSRDGKIVVIHDNNTWKYNGKFKLVKDQTLEELQRLDVGKYRGAQWINERIPTLEQVLQTIPGSKCLFIEIKCGSEIVKELKDIIEKSTLQPDQVRLISCDLDVLKNARKIFPEIEICWVNNIRHLELVISWQPEILKLIAKTKEANLNGLDLSAIKLIDESFVNIIKATGLKLYVWTVNDPLDAKRLTEAGVNGITTNRSQWLKAQLEKLEIEAL